jgi:hypothetical protein
MAFVFWVLFIVVFFSTLFVIIRALQKQYYGWKSAFIPLVILNLVVFGLYILLALIAARAPHNESSIGLAFVGLGLLLVGIIPVIIVDIIGILLFLMQPHSQASSSSTAPTSSQNKSYNFYISNIVVVVVIITVIVMAWWIVFHIF